MLNYLIPAAFILCCLGVPLALRFLQRRRSEDGQGAESED